MANRQAHPNGDLVEPDAVQQIEQRHCQIDITMQVMIVNRLLRHPSSVGERRPDGLLRVFTLPEVADKGVDTKKCQIPPGTRSL